MRYDGYCLIVCRSLTLEIKSKTLMYIAWIVTHNRTVGSYLHRDESFTGSTGIDISSKSQGTIFTTASSVKL